MENPNQNDGLNRLAGAAEKFIKQERWSRRWTNLLKLAVVAYIIVTLVMLTRQIPSEQEMLGTDKHVAIVKLEGAIMPGTYTSAEKLNPLLDKAFKNPNSEAVIIQANSPGGSPVQSALINDEITRLKNLYQKPVYVVVEDACASGCYYIAVAADKIYANKGSLVGSIGVRMDSFGFTGLMDKIGVENRSMHAGEHKTFLNPFGPIDKEGREFFQKRILDRTHEQFIEAVRKGRGDRLKENKNTFTGLVWLGDEAVENGLIDGLGDMGYVEREVIKQTNTRYYETEKGFMEQLLGDISTETATKLSLYLTSLR
ncbi:signal peptide peptidase SppA [Hydrogenovibrio thermophilus]|jgi:protease-4|uniref:Signal peptide peptidase SppA n=1 Tax=Hydrogenovibrio thermophilus TaxID=265883 RepID=A0A410H314_9GAMM|nr:signal peptide peptidase SppA [Hydrogenovibrio thermophilus]QAB15319.1 signal peptide peptidase SppA [Hydrogenovibrio thermophilus]